MFEAMSPDTLVLGVSLVTGVIGLAGGMVLWANGRKVHQTADIKDIVAKAPYERLHNVLPVENGR